MGNNRRIRHFPMLGDGPQQGNSRLILSPQGIRIQFNWRDDPNGWVLDALVPYGRFEQAWRPDRLAPNVQLGIHTYQDPFLDGAGAAVCILTATGNLVCLELGNPNNFFVLQPAARVGPDPEPTIVDERLAFSLIDPDTFVREFMQRLP